jgi:hypothetical protein
MAHEGAIGLTMGLVSNGKTSYYNYGELRRGQGDLPRKDSVYCNARSGQSLEHVNPAYPFGNLVPTRER